MFCYFSLDLLHRPKHNASVHLHNYAGLSRMTKWLNQVLGYMICIYMLMIACSGMALILA